MSQHPELDSSFAKMRSLGVSDEKIKQDALAAGWNTTDIDSAFFALTPPIQVASIVPPTPTSASTFAPPSPVSPIQQSVQLPPFSSSLPPQNHKSPLLAIVLIVILLAGGAGVFAFVQKIGPFAHAPYSETDLMTGLLSKFADINSSTYNVGMALYSSPREADAKPFSIKVTDQGLKERYYRDSQRGQSLQSILSTLQSYQRIGKTFPVSLDDAVKNSAKDTYSYYKISSDSITDHLTKKPYEYIVTEGGKNFSLSATFETSDAIATLLSYGRYYADQSATSTTIQDKKVTFTKDSHVYLNFPVEPPKTMLESWSEYAQYLPPEINVKGSIQVEAGKKENDTLSEWKFMLDGSGDFGDLTYKVNAEALKKDDDYYLRINNIPSLFGGYLPPKGQWIKFSPKTATTTSDSYYGGSIVSSEGISKYEKQYTKQKAASVDFIRHIATFADEEKLFEFKNAPHKETVDNRSLYRYDLKLRKEAVIPFYKKLLDEVSKNKELNASVPMADSGYLNYLESSEFDETFDYYNNNTSITLWVDEAGFPAKVMYSIRVVPTDDARALKDKQIMVELTLSLSNINKPIHVDVPTGAKTYEEVMGGSDNPLSQSRLKGKSAMVRSSLSSIRAQAELFFDKDSSYGKKTFALGSCKNTTGTLFADKDIFNSLTTAGEGDAGKLTCVSSMSDGKVSSYAVSVPLPDKLDYSYCIDSTGVAKEILGALKESSCK